MQCRHPHNQVRSRLMRKSLASGGSTCATSMSAQLMPVPFHLPFGHSPRQPSLERFLLRSRTAFAFSPRVCNFPRTPGHLLQRCTPSSARHNPAARSLHLFPVGDAAAGSEPPNGDLPDAAAHPGDAGGVDAGGHPAQPQSQGVCGCDRAYPSTHVIRSLQNQVGDLGCRYAARNVIDQRGFLHLRGGLRRCAGSCPQYCSRSRKCANVSSSSHNGWRPCGLTCMSVHPSVRDDGRGRFLRVALS